MPAASPGTCPMQELITQATVDTLHLAEFEPLVHHIRSRTQQVFGHIPCLWQLKAVLAILKRDRDVICIAGTGSGKTLTFWIPLLLRNEGVQVVVTALNLLGKQNVDQLAAAGISACCISAENSGPRVFRELEDGLHRAVVINPEIMMKSGGEFEKLCKNHGFTSRIISIIFDEAHCVSDWGSFRPEYKEVGRLRYSLPDDIPFFVTSATLPPAVLSDVTKILQLRSNPLMIRRSNDRPNVFLVVRQIKYALNSFLDLAFLVPNNWNAGDPPPPKFLIFFDSIGESVLAGQSLQRHLPRDFRHKIKWFNSNMSTEFREAEVERLRTGDTWGLCTTDSFGMGMDLRDIALVVQWRLTCKICTIMQRIGRGARDPNLTAVAVIFVEAKYFDDVRAKRAANMARRKSKIKTSIQPTSASLRPPLHSSLPSQNLGPMEWSMTSTSTAELTRLRMSENELRGEESGSELSDSADRMEEIPDKRATMAMELTSNAAESRRATYIGQKNSAAKSRRKLREQDLDPVLDDMINAGPRGIGCRREPTTLLFSNDQILSDHHLCHSALPAGCPRCAVVPSTLCCDQCNPAYFANIAQSHIPKPPKPAARSRLPKTWMATPRDMALRCALEDWREKKTIAVFKRPQFDLLGPALVMGDIVLERIVHCAHEEKITTLEQLKKETRWSKADQHGNEVLALVQLHRPPPPCPVNNISRSQTGVSPAAPSTTLTLSAQAHLPALPAPFVDPLTLPSSLASTSSRSTSFTSTIDVISLPCSLTSTNRKRGRSITNSNAGPLALRSSPFADRTAPVVNQLPASSSILASAVPAAKRTYACSACGQSGHNVRNKKKCPGPPASATGNENCNGNVTSPLLSNPL